MFNIFGIPIALMNYELQRNLAEKKMAEQDRLCREQQSEYERRKYGCDAIDVEARVIEDVPLLQNSADQCTGCQYEIEHNGKKVCRTMTRTHGQPCDAFRKSAAADLAKIEAEMVKPMTDVMERILDEHEGRKQ